MIRNQVTYGEDIILEIYHKGFDETIGSRELSFAEVVEGKKLQFTETLVDKEEVLFEESSYKKEEGLLKTGAKMNPYNQQATASMIHYYSLEKPASLFQLSTNMYDLSISIEAFEEINKFVEKYTGLKIEKFPEYYGDIFIYKSFELRMTNIEKYKLVIENPPSNSTVIVKFKNEELLVSTQIIEISEATQNLEVLCGKEFTTLDLEIYQKNELVYQSEEVSFMRRLDMRLSTSRTVDVPVEVLAAPIQLSIENEPHEMAIGDATESFQEILSNSFYKINKKLRDANSQSTTTFIQPDEGSVAYDLILKEVKKNSDELWIFDPHFTDESSRTKMIDWLRVFTESPASLINVVFHSNDRKLDIEQVQGEINQDRILRMRDSLNLTLWQTKRNIHDRFIFTLKNNEFSGITIGTSFNSLENHYYCITPLNHKAVEIILGDLKHFLTTDSKHKEV